MDETQTEAGFATPSEITAGATEAFVHGRNFEPSVTISWNGKPQVTKFVTGNLAQITLDEGLTDNIGSGAVTADNGDGFISRATTTAIVPGNFEIKTISPASAKAGAAALTLTLKGSGFANFTSNTLTPLVRWNGAELAANIVNAITVTAQVPANLLAVPGNVSVSIRICSQPGCNFFNESNSVTFTVLP
ncbi:MAG TPA: IPT/TIG domain-containing protein [Myxococcales bacterium]